MRVLRHKRGLFLIDVADRVGASVSSIAGWEKGAPMRYRNKLSVCRFYGIETHELDRRMKKYRERWERKHATARKAHT